jgi:hypothetical protein
VAYTPQCAIWCTKVEKSKQTLLYPEKKILKEEKKKSGTIRGFSNTHRRAWGLIQPPIQWELGFLLWVKATGV